MKTTKFQNIALILFFFFLNFEVWDPLSTGGNFSIAKLFGYLYVISILSRLKYFLHIPKKAGALIRLPFIFYGLIVLINLININIHSADIFMFSMLQNIVLFWFIFNHERINPNIIEKGFISFALGSLTLAFFYFQGIGIEINTEGRVSIFGDNENIIGIRMVTSVFILTHLLLQKQYKIRKIIKLIIACAYFPLIALLLNTGSRVSFISLFIGLSLAFILYKSRNWFLKIVILSIGIYASIFAYQAAMESEVLGMRLMNTIDEGHLAGRDEIWKSILPLIQDNWIVGVGWTGYVEYMIGIYGRVRSPHNVILEVLAYSGIIGLFLFLAFIIKSFIYSFIYYKNNKSLIPFLFIIPITGLLLSAQMLHFKLAWIILAYAASRKFYI